MPRDHSGRITEKRRRIRLKPFAGSDTGGERAATIYTIIESAEINGLDPEAYLRHLIIRLDDHPAKRIDELLPWNWKRERLQKAVA